MLQVFHAITVSHKQCHLSQLGEYAIGFQDESTLPSLQRELMESLKIKELLYLATCNRVLYFFTTDQPADASFSTAFFEKIQSLSNRKGSPDLQKIQFYRGEQAIQHVLEVASSVDSLVVGEREIFRQLREAYQKNKEWGLCGDDIRVVMRFAVETAKNVLTNTRIGEKPISVVSLAMEMLRRAPLPPEPRILVIGAGQTNRLVAKFLVKFKLPSTAVFNRSLSKAEELARLAGGRAYPLTELPSYKEGFDVIIICTGAQEPLIQADLYQRICANEKGEKLIIDLSVPHNVARDVIADNDIEYIEIERLRTLANQNQAFRQREIESAKALIAEALETFESAYHQRLIERAMHQVPTQIKQIKTRIFEEVFSNEVQSLDENSRATLEKALLYMEKKCISISMKAAKEVTI